MADCIALIDARDEVLRKIGRNVVNFARMEAMLKFLNTQQHISGALSDLPKIAARAKKVASRRPMGRLAEEFVRSVYSSAETSFERASSEASVAFSFRIEADPAVAAERKRALRAVVRERNKLVHKWLAAFDTNSLESCEALGTALDAQNALVRPELEALRELVLALREYQRDATRYFESDEFIAELKKGIASA